MKMPGRIKKLKFLNFIITTNYSLRLLLVFSHYLMCFSFPSCKVNSLCPTISLVSALLCVALRAGSIFYSLFSFSLNSSILHLCGGSAPPPYHHFNELKIGSSELENAFEAGVLLLRPECDI